MRILVLTRTKTNLHSGSCGAIVKTLPGVLLESDKEWQRKKWALVLIRRFFEFSERDVQKQDEKLTLTEVASHSATLRYWAIATRYRGKRMIIPLFYSIRIRTCCLQAGWKLKPNEIKRQKKQTGTRKGIKRKGKRGAPITCEHKWPGEISRCCWKQAKKGNPFSPRNLCLAKHVHNLFIYKKNKVPTLSLYNTEGKAYSCELPVDLRLRA